MDFEKEYTILCIIDKGPPFTTRIFKSFQDAYNNLMEMIETEEKRNRTYYVDNDFYENKYQIGVHKKYFSIQERQITTWTKYKEEKTTEKNKDNLVLFRKRG